MSLNPALCIDASDRLPKELFDNRIEFLLSNRSFLRVLLLLHQQIQIKIIRKIDPIPAQIAAIVTSSLSKVGNVIFGSHQLFLEAG